MNLNRNLVTLPNKRFGEISNVLLKNGKTIHFEAKGKSMEPSIFDGDIVEILPFNDGMKLKKGDIILCNNKENNPIIHRVIQMNPVIIAKGDNSGYPDLSITSDNIIGKIVSIARGTKVIKPTNSKIKLLFMKKIYKIKKLFNPEFLVPNQREAIISVKKKYNQAEEVIYHRNTVKEGLEEWEQYFLNKYMRGKGKVLNIGCGAGREAINFAKKGFKVTGIDISENMIKVAKEESRIYNFDIDFDVCSVTDIDKYESLSFDYIVFTRALYSYIPEKNLRIEVLKKAKKLLANNGFIAISGYIVKRKWYQRENISNFIRRNITSKIYGLRNNIEKGDFIVDRVSPVLSKGTCFCHFFSSKDEIRDEIEKAGLKVKELWKENFWILGSDIADIGVRS